MTGAPGSGSPQATRSPARVWVARLAVGAVLALNLSAALPYLARPEAYVAGFGLEGAPGAAMVRGLGVLFLMWNATYPLVVIAPDRHKALFGVVLAQQAIGLLGEAWIAASLPGGPLPLQATVARFLVFDSIGLAVMGAGFLLLHRRGARPR